LKEREVFSVMIKRTRCFLFCFVPVLLISIGVSLLIVSSGLAAPDASGLRLPIRFAVIGDRTGGHVPGVHGAIMTEIERMKPDFVVGVGDMIEGYSGDVAAIEEEWKEYLGLAGTFTMPFYMVPGNHDIWDSTSAELYRKHVGEPYYSFDAGPIHFVVLDTGRWSTASSFPQEQLEWLASDLEENLEAEYKIVVYHIPYWIETIAKGNPDPLHDICTMHGVDAVFTGHYHVYFSGRYDDISYTGVGSSGGGCEPGLTGLEYHFVWVTVDGDGISIAPVKMGSVLPWNEVTAETFNLVNEITREALQIDRVPVGISTSIEMSDFSVKVKNFSMDSTLSGTLEWGAEEAWSIRPKRLPIQIAPGQTHEAGFQAATRGPLYPVPVLSLAYPYAPDRTIDIESPLGLARTVYARKAEVAPTIDGRLSEDVWEERVTDLYTGYGFTETADSTSFSFAWDQSNLYIGALCMEEDMGSLVAGSQEHDGAVYGEDCVGFFFQPDVPDGPLYQIYFNPLGTAFDQKITVEDGRYTDVDRGWDGMYDVAVSKHGDRWVFEACIPLDQLETEGQYEKTWAVNFRRKQKRLATSADWQVPIGYDPVDYGYLIMQ
jgi:3',5'-cyclic AMP phosphodiesterase CpdA